MHDAYLNSRRLHLSGDFAFEGARSRAATFIQRRHSTMTANDISHLDRERDKISHRSYTDTHRRRMSTTEWEGKFRLTQNGLIRINTNYEHMAHPRTKSGKEKSASSRAPFVISLCSGLKQSASEVLVIAPQSVPSSNPAVMRSEAKACAQSVASTIRDLLLKRESLDWIPLSEIEKMHTSLQRLLYLILSMKKDLGVDDTRPSRYQQPFRRDQAALMIKVVALSLSRETAALTHALANIPQPADESDTGVDPATLRECSSLSVYIAGALGAARRLVPCDALRTLCATRRLLGAAILRRMGLAAGAAVPEPEADRRLRALFADFDADGSGAISRAELAAALARLDVAVDDAEVDRLVAAADADGDGEIGLPEFLGLARAVLAANGVRVVSAAVAALLRSSSCPSAFSAAAATSLAPVGVGAVGVGGDSDGWEALLASVTSGAGPPSPSGSGAATSGSPHGGLRRVAGSPIRRAAAHSWARSPMRSRYSPTRAAAPPAGSESPLRSGMKLLSGHGLPVARRGQSPARRLGSPTRSGRRESPTRGRLSPPVRFPGGPASPLRSLTDGGGYSHLQPGARGLLSRRRSGLT